MKSAALHLIRGLLERPGAHAAVLWSSGKDSMALLHLVRQVWADVPVVLLREPAQPARYAFANRIIQEWKLPEVHDFNPEKSFICTRHNHTSIIHRYRFGARGLDLPVDMVELDGEPWACGLDVMARPKSVSSPPWNLLFSGARSADSVPLLGPMPLSAAVVRQPDFPTLAFPMRDWTDVQLWEYLETEQVPVQANRYERTADGWRERADKRNNPDYLAGCVRCLTPGESPTVQCPRHGTVNRVADAVPSITQPLPFYIT